MALPACPVSWDKANYVSQIAPGAVFATKLSGGKSARRLDQLGASSIVTVTATLSKDDYATIVGFFNNDLKLGSLPFTTQLVLGGASLDTYNAFFVEDTFGVQGVVGETYTVGAQLEVWQ